MGVPTWPETEALLTTGTLGAAAILKVTVALAVPAVFVARNVTTVPAAVAVGVPEMTPVLAVNVRPAGRVPLKMDNVGAGVPLAANV
jgi:hypothetical protein